MPLTPPPAEEMDAIRQVLFPPEPKKEALSEDDDQKILEDLRKKLDDVHGEFSKLGMDDNAIQGYMVYRSGFRMDKSWSLPKGAMCHKELAAQATELKEEISKAELEQPKKLEALEKFRENHIQKKSAIYFQFPSQETDYDRRLHTQEDKYVQDANAIWSSKGKLRALLCNNSPIDAEAFHDKMGALIDEANNLLYRIRMAECRPGASL